MTLDLRIQIPPRTDTSRVPHPGTRREKVHNPLEKLTQDVFLKSYAAQNRKKLGSGATATVRLWTYNEKQYAVKHIKVLPAKLGDEQSLDMYRTVLKVTKSEIYYTNTLAPKLKHRNLTKVFKAFCLTPDSIEKGEGNIDAYIIMEYVNGRELFDLMNDAYKDGSLLPMNKVKNFARQIFDLVRYLHEHGVVHRDIKPENILVTNGDTIKLADFGFARKLSGMEEATSCVGTKEFMAPELEVGNPTYRSGDWWSVGILLYQLLSGGYGPYKKGKTTRDMLEGMIGKELFATNDMFQSICELIIAGKSVDLGKGGARSRKEEEQIVTRWQQMKIDAYPKKVADLQKFYKETSFDVVFETERRDLKDRDVKNCLDLINTCLTLNPEKRYNLIFGEDGKVRKTFINHAFFKQAIRAKGRRVNFQQM